MSETLHSVDTALRLLRELQGGEELGVTELAARLSTGTSTVHRLVSTLVQAEFVERTSARRYRILPVPLPLPDEKAAVDHCAQVAAPHLESLSDATGETVHVSVLREGYVEFIAVHESANRVRVSSRVGESLPAHATASGKCLLANLLPRDMEEFLRPLELMPVTTNTTTSKDALRAELAGVLASKLAFNASESEVGLNALAVPLHRPRGAVLCALTVAGPSSGIRFDGPAGERVIAQLRQSAHDIEQQLTL